MLTAVQRVVVEGGVPGVVQGGMYGVVYTHHGVLGGIVGRYTPLCAEAIFPREEE